MSYDSKAPEALLYLASGNHTVDRRPMSFSELSVSENAIDDFQPDQ